MTIDDTDIFLRVKSTNTTAEFISENPTFRMFAYSGSSSVCTRNCSRRQSFDTSLVRPFHVRRIANDACAWQTSTCPSPIARPIASRTATATVTSADRMRSFANKTHLSAWPVARSRRLQPVTGYSVSYGHVSSTWTLVQVCTSYSRKLFSYLISDHSLGTHMYIYITCDVIAARAMDRYPFFEKLSFLAKNN